MTIRPAAVAGRFYPGVRGELVANVESLLAEARPAPFDEVPRAIIAPHAGYVYSGPVAGSAFSMLEPLAAKLRRVVVIGPSHYIGFEGIAASPAVWFRTPLGDMPVDVDAMQKAWRHGVVTELETAHEREHSIETHLPFLQSIHRHARLVPLVTGLCDDDALAALLDDLWDDQTVICVSSDLSHFEDYDSATAHDASTTAKILALDSDIRSRDACGALAIRGLLAVARSRGLKCEAVDVRNSGDTAGGRDRVVGYGAYGFWR